MFGRPTSVRMLVIVGLMRMRRGIHGGRCSFAILRWCHGRQLLNEADDRPNAAVFVRRAEGRHAGHSNAVFDNPEQFRGCPAWGCVSQAWWTRIEAPADLARLLARCAVTLNAHFIEVARALRRSIRQVC